MPAFLLAPLRAKPPSRKDNAISHQSASTPSSRFHFIDLFAGIGGFRKAFDSVGGQCVFTCERDRFSQTTYRTNFSCDHPSVSNIHDVTKSKESLAGIPPHDLLLAGFPCQPFSIAGIAGRNATGRPHGFGCEEQGRLFFDIARIIGFHRPKAFLLENVKNLVSHDGGKTFRRMCHVLERDLGYHIHHRIIDGQYWVPQRRQRVFIAGFRDGCEFDFNALPFPNLAEKPVLSSILHNPDTEEDELPYFFAGRVAEKYTISDKLWSFLQAHQARHRKSGNGFGFSLVGPDDVAGTLPARYGKDGSNILIRQQNKNPRRLTPRECARLMGFDRPGEAKFIIPVSDTQAYKQFGNAVIVPAVEAVALLMRPNFQERKYSSNSNRF